jgi:putative tryptophan/tyrosine transport system substrate-binding protein
VTTKVVELLNSTVTGLQRLAVLLNPDTGSNQVTGALILSRMQEATRSLGIQTRIVEVRSPNDFDAAFARAAAWHAQAMYVLNDGPVNIISGSYPLIAQLALRFGLPTTTAAAPRPFVAAGGLMGYGGSIPAQFQRTAYYVDRILRGTSPSELPIEQSATLDLSSM